MATAPVKSQPLHNFSLPHLRWAHNHHRFRRRPSPDIHHTSPSSSAAADESCPPDHDNSNVTVHVSKPSSSRAPRKPFISFSPCRSGGGVLEKERDKHDVIAAEEGEGATEGKPWKLRPRKVLTMPSSTASFKKGGEKMVDETTAYLKTESCFGVTGGYGVQKSTRVRGTSAAEAGGSERQRKVVEDKKRLWISLSREEIEEDVYALTGSRPSRRPKKRPKNVQKQLDNVFPGLYLVGLNVDSYRIPDPLR